MKPLLGGHKTPEDRAIWLRMADRYIRKPGAFGITSYTYRNSDRRDAELMLEWQTDRGMLAYADSQIVYVRGGGGVPEFYA
jgi:hypothetical protein